MMLVRDELVNWRKGTFTILMPDSFTGLWL